MPPEAVARAYAISKERLPNTIVYLNHASTNLVSTLRQYNAGTDIVAVDIYPVNPGVTGLDDVVHPDGLQGDLNNPYVSQVGEYVRKMRRVAGPNRPVFCVQQAFAWEQLKHPSQRRRAKVLYPTYEEVRFMAYQAIIESATGILYWGSHTLPKGAPLWPDIKRVVAELSSMEEVLVTTSTAVELPVVYHEVGYSVDDDSRSW